MSEELERGIPKAVVIKRVELTPKEIEQGNKLLLELIEKSKEIEKKTEE